MGQKHSRKMGKSQKKNGECEVFDSSVLEEIASNIRSNPKNSLSAHVISVNDDFDDDFDDDDDDDGDMVFPPPQLLQLHRTF